MQISGNFSVSRTDIATNSAQKNASTQSAADTSTSFSAPVDQLDLSAEALAASGNSSAGEAIRADKVAQLREAIASGNYDTHEKLSKALDNFLDQLG